MRPIYLKTIEYQHRRSKRAVAQILVITIFALAIYGIASCGAKAYIEFDGKLEQMHQDMRLMQWDLENLRYDNQVLQQQLDALREEQAEWLERFEVSMVTVTAYAPLDPNAVEGMCYSGDPNITASGAQVVPGVTIAATLPFGTRVWIEGYGVRVVQDRGGMVGRNDIDIAVATMAEAVAIGRHKARVLIL